MAKSRWSPVPPPEDETHSPLWKRLLWLLLFMAISLSVVVISAYFIRALLFIG